MKLSYFSFAALAAIAEARNGMNTEKYRCDTINVRFKGGHRQISAEKYDEVIAAKVAAYEAKKFDDSDEALKATLNSEVCLNLFAESTQEQDEQYLEDQFPTGSDCGSKAAEYLGNLMACELAQKALDDEATKDNEVGGLRAVVNDGFKGQDSDSTHDYLATSVELTVSQTVSDDVNADLKESTDSLEKCDDTEKVCGSRSKKPVTMTSIRVWFKQVNSKVWNVVVSGGPEYCKDMLPKYPRITYGKMTKKNPNYHMVKEIRDNCIILHGVIKGTKCFCIYVLWGCPEAKKASVKRCPPSWQRRKASGNEAKYCFYFSNLKGGIYRPKKQPSNPFCKTALVAAMGSNKKKGDWASLGWDGDTVAGYEEMVEYFKDVDYKDLVCDKKRIKEYIGKAKKYRGKKGRNNIKKYRDYKKKMQKCTQPKPPPKATWDECRDAGEEWCDKYYKKKGAHVYSRCKKGLNQKSDKDMKKFCVKLGLNM